MAESKRKLVKVIVMARHGCRAPSRGSLKPFQSDANTKADDSVGHSILTEWPDNELEMITPIGVNQLTSLGQWFAQEYFGKEHPNFLPEGAIKQYPQGEFGPFAWYSSTLSRVMDSGRDFWQGFGTSFADPLPCREQEVKDGKSGDENKTLTTAQITDATFKAWDTEKSYTSWVATLKDGKEFQAKGEEDTKFLDEMWSRYRCVEPLSYGLKLSNMTYFMEVAECEKFTSFTAEGEKDVKTEKPRKSALEHSLSEEEAAKVNHLAHWVFNARFFSPPWGAVIGGRILNRFVADSALYPGSASAPASTALITAASRFSFYSAHDYTILSLLSAMGLPAYPTDHNLSFACYLLWEVYEVEHKENGVSQTALAVRVRLNRRPFETDRSQSTAHVQSHFEELALPGVTSKGFLPLSVIAKQAAGQ